MSIVRQVAAALLRAALRLAPADSRRWGTAMLHELDYIDDDFAVFGWALGGVCALGRHAVGHLRPRQLLAAGRPARVWLAGASLLFLLAAAVAMGGRGVRQSRPASSAIGTRLPAD